MFALNLSSAAFSQERGKVQTKTLQEIFDEFTENRREAWRVYEGDIWTVITDAVIVEVKDISYEKFYITLAPLTSDGKPNMSGLTAYGIVRAVTPEQMRLSLSYKPGDTPVFAAKYNSQLFSDSLLFQLVDTAASDNPLE